MIKEIARIIQEFLVPKQRLAYRYAPARIAPARRGSSRMR